MFIKTRMSKRYYIAIIILLILNGLFCINPLILALSTIQIPIFITILAIYLLSSIAPSLLTFILFDKDKKRK